jgi:hypothetical protein
MLLSNKDGFCCFDGVFRGESFFAFGVIRRDVGKREVCNAETGRVGVVACSTLTEWRVRGVTLDLGVNGSRSIDGGAEARPDGVVWLIEPSEEQASISCSNRTKSGNGPV